MTTMFSLIGPDLFTGWSLEEFVRLYECAFTAISLLGFVVVMGLPSPSSS
jgi:hypothetical protein